MAHGHRIPARRHPVLLLVAAIAWMGLAAPSFSGEPAPIPLPAPQTTGGMPLMQALGLSESRVVVLAMSVGRP